ncbi:peptidylprolyl isomerase [Alienimonas californiensis]|uniref:peptidylprolyl isomerase n=1 Tax=Alienimonas californiensis TaxID=2527989 RepID=A0A517PFD8_9PLAN|nr:peptidylprolyl isomerase [Alienimonas californiensis]QDT18086.1 Peptidyl-prolyl cis-trans isomerase B [Alienimonas californiensis]
MRVPPPPRFPSPFPGAALAALACVGLLSVGCIRDYEDPNAPSFTAEDEADAKANPAPADDAANLEPFRVEFVTTEGPFVVEARPEWAPLGAARFKTLVEEGYFDGAAFFRVIPGFVAQFGLAADPADSARWQGTDMKDEPVRASNTPGTLSFAKSGPNTRTTQMFINLGDNSGSLDPQGFSPFAEIVSGGDVPAKFHAEEVQDQGTIEARGAAYLEKNFPELDTITTARIVPRSEWAADAGSAAAEGTAEDAGADFSALAGPEMEDPTPGNEPAPEPQLANEAPEEAMTEESSEQAPEAPADAPAGEESAAEGSSDEPAMADPPTPEPQPDTPPTPDPTPEPGTPPEPQPDPAPNPNPSPDPAPEPEPQPDPTPEPEESEEPSA